MLLNALSLHDSCFSNKKLKRPNFILFFFFFHFQNSVHSPVLIQSGRSTPLSNVSTLSPSNSSVSLDLEEDSPLSQSLPGPSMPVLKWTKPREFPEPPKKKVKHLAQDFKLPISSKVNEFVQQNRSLDESTRRQLIRETVTCVQAYVGEHVSSNHFEEAAKQLCEKVPLLRDVKPPLWPDEIEFSYWVCILTCHSDQWFTFVETIIIFFFF